MYDLKNQEDREITKEIKDKIKSKMDVAKFFSGFISIFMGLSFKEMINPLQSKCILINTTAWVGFFFILLSIAFSIITMFALDRLLMPFELWKTLPTGSFNEKLKEEMIIAWRKLFYKSVFFFLIGIFFLLISLTKCILFPIIILVLILSITYFFYESLKIEHKIFG